MEKLSESLRVIIQAEAQNFKDLTHYLYFCHGFLDQEKNYFIKVLGRLSPFNFYPPETANKTTPESLDGLKLSVQQKEILADAHLFYPEKDLKKIAKQHSTDFPPKTKILFLDEIIQETVCNANKKLQSSFPSDELYRFIYNCYFSRENLIKAEENFDPEKKHSVKLFWLFHLQSYAIFKFYENFDDFCSLIQIEPEKLFYDLWLWGDYIKQKSQFLVGYWTVARDATHKPILSAKAKTKKAEKNIETVKNLLLEKYNNQACSDFYIEAMTATGRGERTIKNEVKKIREVLEKE